MSGRFEKRKTYLVMQHDAVDWVVQSFAVMAFADREMAEECADRRNERNQLEAYNGDLFADEIWYDVKEVELVDFVKS